MANAFERLGCTVERYDYRSKRKKLLPWWLIAKQLAKINEQFAPDAVLIQCAEKMPASIPAIFNCTRIFWSTEPLIRRRDVDALLSTSGLFDWTYLHTYTCAEIAAKEFPHLIDRSSVLHNAGAMEVSQLPVQKTRFALFNRNVSNRRQQWLTPVNDLVDVIGGRFGEPYFDDLRQSHIAVNIHFAEESVDDFETGIFEAMCCGCAVVSESLNPKTVADMNMDEAIVQVRDANELRAALLRLRDNPDHVKLLQDNGRKAMENNHWDNRAEQAPKPRPRASKDRFHGPMVR